MRPRLPRGFVLASRSACAAAIAAASTGSTTGITASPRAAAAARRPRARAVSARSAKTRLTAPSRSRYARASGFAGTMPRPDLVRDHDHRRRVRRRELGRRRGLREHGLLVAVERVRDPEREAVDDRRGARVDGSDRVPQLERLLDRRPRGGPLAPVPRDPCRHLLVERLGRGDERHRPVPLLGEPLRRRGLPRAGAAEEEDEAHARTGTTASVSPSSSTRTRAP